MASARLPQECVEYLLCRFVEAAGAVEGRIRMQKAAFLLGAAGCPLFDDFFYHLRGPYSPGLANTLGQLVDQHFLDESQAELAPDVFQYTYRLSSGALAALVEFRKCPSARGLVELGDRYESIFKRLVCRPVRELELAATVLYWRQYGYGMTEATKIAADLKGSTENSAEMTQALALATEIAEHQN